MDSQALLPSVTQVPATTARFHEENEILLARPEKSKCLIQLVQELESKLKVFNDDYSTPKLIISFMNKIIRKIIREPLIVIYERDEPFAEMLIHAFFHQLKHIRSEKDGEMWMKTKEKLYCLLAAAYVSNLMSHIYSEQEEYFENHKYFETTALTLFNEMYLENNKKIEYHVLAYDYERVYIYEKLYISKNDKIIEEEKERKKKEEEWEKASRELLCVAYRGECTQFISHVACQNYIKTRWKERKVAKLFGPGNKETSNETPQLEHTNNSLNKQTQQLFEPENGNATSQLFYSSCSARLSLFLSYLQKCMASFSDYFRTPRTKYFFHMVFNFAYIIAFACVLLLKPWLKILAIEPGKLIKDPWFIVFINVLAIHICDVITQIIKIYFYYHKRLRAYWWSSITITFIRVIIAFINLVIFTLAVFNIYSVVFFSLLEILFTSSFVMSTLTTLKFLSLTNYFGAKIQLIKTMAKSILKYMSILIVFWLIYAVCYLSLTEGIRENEKSTVWQFFQSGAFEIFGELKDEDRIGNLSNCENIYWLSTDFGKPDQVRCLFRSTLIPPLLFLYMITATVMLINIFTAMLSHEYEKTSESAGYYSKFHKYEMLCRFETKIFLPRPLNIVFLFPQYIYLFMRCWCEIKKIYFFEKVSWGSTPADAKVMINDTEVENLMKKVLEKRGTHFVEDIRSFLNSWIEKRKNTKQPLDGGIEEAQEVLQGVIQKFSEYLGSKTSEDQRRHDTIQDITHRSSHLLSELILNSKNPSVARLPTSTPSLTPTPSPTPPTALDGRTDRSATFN